MFGNSSQFIGANLVMRYSLDQTNIYSNYVHFCGLCCESSFEARGKKAKLKHTSKKIKLLYLSFYKRKGKLQSLWTILPTFVWCLKHVFVFILSIYRLLLEFFPYLLYFPGKWDCLEHDRGNVLFDNWKWWEVTVGLKLHSKCWKMLIIS